MKVYEHPSYDGQFPENFDWLSIDSHKLSILAVDLSKFIKIQLEQPPGNRVHVAGLRFALARIAGMAEVI